MTHKKLMNNDAFNARDFQTISYIVMKKAVRFEN